MNTKCQKCKTELHFEQLAKIVLIRTDELGQYHKVYCPKCKTYDNLRHAQRVKRVHRPRKMKPTK